MSHRKVFVPDSPKGLFARYRLHSNNELVLMFSACASLVAELHFLSIWVPLYLQNGEGAGSQGHQAHSEPVKHDQVIGIQETVQPVMIRGHCMTIPSSFKDLP
jgi:hypothetical protein